MTQQDDDNERLFAAHQRRLFLYISAMLPSRADAEEVLSETNMVIWKKLEEFQPGTDFLAWAYRIAQFQVLYYRRRKAGAAVAFSPEVLDQLTAVAEEDDAVLERRREALARCTGKLAEEDRVLVERCYAPDANTYEVASSLGRAATSVYRSLRRIRRQLAQCIERTLASEGSR